VPREFDDAVEGAWILDSREDTIEDLEIVESLAGPVGHDLQIIMTVPIEVARVLAPLGPELRDRIHRGDQGFIAPGEYVHAMRWIEHEVSRADGAAEAAKRKLIDSTRAKAYWQSTEFVLFAAGLALFSVICAVVVAWRVSAATRELGERHEDARESAEQAEERARQLQLLMEVGRRLSIDAEPGVIASTIVDEVVRMLTPHLCVLAYVRDGQVVPAVWRGVDQTATVSFRDGVAGRAADTSRAMRTVVPAEALLPGLPGPLSLLAAPLTVDGRVAAVILVGRTGSTMFSDDDETVLELVAMMSAGALRSAERYGTTLALALDDALTGLGNRRRLDRDLGEIGPERGRAVSFLMIDIDFFKLFNDRHGHPAGDVLLRAVGDAISQSVRAGDIAYRFGGEEFSVLLPDTDAATAIGVAERVRHAVAAIVPPAGADRITVSVGVSVGAPATTNTKLIEEADRALYDAKRSGRDRVTFAGAGVGAAPAATASNVFAPPSFPAANTE
jgi:diguanylate cyclase (GGDEF)-like protein